MTGPFVNSWPARLLTLEISRFTLIFGPPKKCPNQYFCSIISLGYTQPLKLDPRKRGSKIFAVDRAVSKKCPPPGPFINSSFWSHQNNQRKNGVFRFSRSRFLAQFSLVGFFLFRRRKIILKFFGTRKGLRKKQGKTRVFFACLVADFFGGGVFHGVLMLVFLFMYLLRCKCVFLPCRLTCFSFCFLLCLYFFLGGGVIYLFTLITSMVLYQ